MHNSASVSVYVPSQTNHVPTVTCKLHFNIPFLQWDSSDRVCSGFPAKLFYAFLCPLIGATSHDHLIPMELVVLLIFHESSSLRSFFYTFPLLLPFQVGTSIFLKHTQATLWWQPCGTWQHVLWRTGITFLKDLVPLSSVFFKPILTPLWWKIQVTSKRRYLLTKLNSITSKKSIILRTTDFTRSVYILSDCNIVQSALKFH